MVQKVTYWSTVFRYKEQVQGQPAVDLQYRCELRGRNSRSGGYNLDPRQGQNLESQLSSTRTWAIFWAEGEDTVYLKTPGTKHLAEGLLELLSKEAWLIDTWYRHYL